MSASRLIPCLAPLLLLLPACGDQRAARHDQGAPTPDLATPDLRGADLAGTPPADLVMEPDSLAEPPDLREPIDLARPKTDGGGSQGPNAAINCGNGVVCQAPKSVCCRAAPWGAGVCMGLGDACGSLRWLCDDPSDCGVGQVCCRGAAGSSCMTEADCTAIMGSRMCQAAADCAAREMCCGQGPSPAFFCAPICPISRRAYKTDIRYLDETQRQRLHDDLMGFRLGNYRYKAETPAAPRHLGFIIDDVGDSSPSVAPDGEHVDLYGYASMAVAAIQVQAKQIEELRREVRVLRRKLERREGKASGRSRTE